MSAVDGIVLGMRFNMAKERYYDFDAIYDMDRDQKIKAIRRLSKVANERLRQLEKHGHTNNAYKYAQEYADKKEKPRYNIRTKSHRSLNYTLRSLQKFLTAETSTLSGYKRIEKRRAFTLADKLNISDVEEFILFLNSETYKKLKEYYPSEAIAEDYSCAKTYYGMTHDEIISQYEEFLKDKTMSWDDLQEARKRRYGDV